MHRRISTAIAGAIVIAALPIAACDSSADALNPRATRHRELGRQESSTAAPNAPMQWDGGDWDGTEWT